MLSIQGVSQHYTTVLDSLQQLGQHYFRNGRFEDALSTLNHGITLPHATDVPYAYTHLLLTYGHVLLWQSSLLTGDYALPLEVLQAATQRAERLGSQITQARAYDELGFCHYQYALTNSRNFDQAASYFQRSLRLWEQVDDIAGICTTRFHLGLVAERASQFARAEAHFAWVYTTAQTHHVPSSQAEASRHLGFAALRTADYEKALALFQEARMLTEEQRSRLFLPFAYTAVGEVYHMQQNYAEAQQFYEQAATLAAELGVKRATVQILYNLGELAEDQGQRETAQKHYLEARAIAQTIQFQLGLQMITAKLKQLQATQ